ncbi:SDR family NAD(P)-dependent oxidoreductase [Mycobacterium spongiae]|uniref:SDR family NAD(P)-dependent oxidoreductase n=1 Tax=Mycobacterium spongiae TaxID=886343 RepID=UPI001BA8EAA2|nr:SDR family NAD(P)-dependent oxidoreductase [Mycobacterium spongiae]
MNLRGKRVVVTGASRGIGAALARAFRDAGAVVALVARTEDTLTELANELGGTAHIADLSDPAEVATLFADIEDQAGPVDVLVNNAADVVVAGFASVHADELHKVTQVNYLAAAELCRQAIPRMLQRNGGHIVNVSSLMGCTNLPGLLVYSASKAALSHFTAGLRVDLRGLPISTTLVELGPIPTDMLAKTKTYEPTARSFRRLHYTGALVAIPAEKVAERTVIAVQKGRKHVRLPKRAAAVSMIVEIPRRATEFVLTGMSHQAT